MIPGLAWRLLTSVGARPLRKFAWTCGWKSVRAVHRFQARLRKGEFFPAFLFISVTNRCNLGCQGCWVDPGNRPADMDPAMLEDIIRQSRRQGASFFGLLGGEPLLCDALPDIIARFPDCYFLLFTNGTLITDSVAARWRKLGNVSPLVSVEGDEQVSDVRRGGDAVLARSLEGLGHCRRHRLVTGVATSVCKSNIDALVRESFVRRLVDEGVHYLWYYLYRPVGPRPAPELALSAGEILRVRRFMVEIRPRVPMMIVDSYWDHRGRAMCPAAVGISHHINPAGQIEPCPPVQFSRDRVGDAPLAETFNKSTFLQCFRNDIARETRGCVLMENPALLRDVVRKTGALDSTGRGTGMAELEAMGVVPSHHLPGQEIPESYWPYRFAKKHWFFGFGAYG